MPGPLNRLELFTLVAADRLGDGEAYGVTVQREIASIARHSVSIGAVYAALERLERLGLVIPHFSEPRPERGGRARRLFTVTAAGHDAIRRARSDAVRLWGALPAPRGGRRS